jgi:uncharacterized protein YndB with AHSA1/START domain
VATNTSVVHESFTLTRRFAASPAEVFALFSDETTWRRWFRMPGSSATYTHDFRVGGVDHATAEFRMPDGRIEHVENTATYLAINPEARIVYAYTVRIDDIPRWASLVTVVLTPDADGTELSWTEQVAFLQPGPDDFAHLRGGGQFRFNAMKLALEASAATPA